MLTGNTAEIEAITYELAALIRIFALIAERGRMIRADDETADESPVDDDAFDSGQETLGDTEPNIIAVCGRGLSNDSDS